MGHKVHPYAFRLGVLRNWQSRWFAKTDKEYKKNLQQDIEIRKFVSEKTKTAGVSRVEIQRAAGEVTLILHTSKPGILIGQSGGNIDKMRTHLKKQFENVTFDVKVVEIRKPDLEAVLLADSIARQVEKRISYRRAAKAAIQRAMEGGAKGAKVILSGRLNGAEIARTETYKQGAIPLHTLRADIDFASDFARTSYGSVGVKVWVYRGLIFGKEYLAEPEFVTSGKELRGGHLIVGGASRR